MSDYWMVQLVNSLILLAFGGMLMLRSRTLLRQRVNRLRMTERALTPIRTIDASNLHKTKQEIRKLLKEQVVS